MSAKISKINLQLGPGPKLEGVQGEHISYQWPVYLLISTEQKWRGVSQRGLVSAVTGSENSKGGLIYCLPSVTLPQALLSFFFFFFALFPFLLPLFGKHGRYCMLDPRALRNRKSCLRQTQQGCNIHSRSHQVDKARVDLSANKCAVARHRNAKPNTTTSIHVIYDV